MKKTLFFLSFILLLSSCGNEDDICMSTDSTPRLKLKFKSEITGKLIQLDSLYVDVDYGKAEPSAIISSANVDSVFIPMRIDENPYTDIFIRTKKFGDKSKIRINYQSKNIYVSPACGFKKNYENLNAELLQSNPVLNVEPNHTSLTDESKINFYLRF